MIISIKIKKAKALQTILDTLKPYKADLHMVIFNNQLYNVLNLTNNINVYGSKSNNCFATKPFQKS